MRVAEPGHAECCHDRGHLGADVGHLVDGRKGQVAGVRPRAMPLPAAGAAMLPGGETVETAQRPELNLDLVEQSEGEIDRDPHLVGETAAAQERLGALRRRAGVALVAETGRGLGDVADHDERGLGSERVGKGGGEVGAQQEIGLGDVAPARNRRAVDEHALGEQSRVDPARFAAEMAAAPGKVTEPEINGADTFRRDPLDNVRRVAHLIRSSP